MMALKLTSRHMLNGKGTLRNPLRKIFLARKVRTIALNKVQGTYWNAIKCKEHLGNRPEAVVRQATINNSQVWKSLENSLPKLYCVVLAEAYVMQESVNLRTYCEKIGMFCTHPMDVCMRNLQRKAERGKKTSANSYTRFPWASCFKKMHDVCQKYGGARMAYYLGVSKVWENRMRNLIPMQPRKARRN